MLVYTRDFPQEKNRISTGHSDTQLGIGSFTRIRTRAGRKIPRRRAFNWQGWKLRLKTKKRKYEFWIRRDDLPHVASLAVCQSLPNWEELGPEHDGKHRD